jgi:hypothetical protein
MTIHLEMRTGILDHRRRATLKYFRAPVATSEKRKAQFAFRLLFACYLLILAGVL